MLEHPRRRVLVGPEVRRRVALERSRPATNLLELRVQCHPRSSPPGSRAARRRMISPAMAVTGCIHVW